MKLVVMLIGQYHGIDGKISGSTQSSTLFSGKERGKIYSVGSNGIKGDQRWCKFGCLGGWVMKG